jgi:DNA adenine methylase
MISPLRYPGSKKRLANFVHQSLLLNNLLPSLYVEPFIGGASVALHLIAMSAVDQVILMDIDPMIIGFWDVVFNDTEWLIEQIRTVPVTLERWQYYKHTQPNGHRSQALTCLFLNRTSFSGILQQAAGPLGGLRQESEYPIDCRFPRQTLIDRINEIATYRNCIKAIWCCSWEEGIRRIREGYENTLFPQENLFFYLDPPFFKKAEKLYRFIFTQKDHIRLRDFLLTLEDKWLLSYDATDEFEQLYGEAIAHRANGTQRQHIGLHYTTAMQQNPRRACEVILSNFEHLPETNGEV